MSRPTSAMMARARFWLTPGISASRATAGSAASVALALPLGGPVGVHAPGGGDRRGQVSRPAGEWAILPSRAAIWSSSRAASSP